ncbi:MAG: LCP family protein [Lachnospiraceae bacterium]|nr:LCP family protein [Lachnospiraceae bacterium]
MATKKTKRVLKKGKIVLLIAEVLLLIGVGVALAFVLRSTGDEGITKYEIDDVQTNSDVKQNFEENEELQQYRNIALFAVDSRNSKLAKGTRSDSIMICSINETTGEVKLVSVYRDTYLNIGNDVYNKCNSAYAKGGPEQAITMLNMNLDLYITDFVTVGFEGLMKTIDGLGGVDINVTEAEIPHLNNYQASMYCTEENPNNLTTNYVPVTKSGLQTLSGYQATAYCRIRAIGNDFQRTERQRTVIQQALVKAKTASATKLTTIMNDVLPLIATSLDADELATMVAGIAKYNISQTSGFPFDGSITTGNIGSKGSCVVPLNLEKNVIELHEFLYPGVEYTPSEDVKAYSQKIMSDTSPYVGGAVSQ